MIRKISNEVILLFLIAFASFGQGKVCAQLLTDIPSNAKGIGVEEKLGGFIPLDLAFEDEEGRSVKIADLVDGKRPLLLTLNYSGCPGLCVAQLDGLATGLADLNDLDLGKDFQLLSVSINPRETAERAKGTKEKYTKDLSTPHDREGWHFWTGTPASIAKITSAVGFQYTYDADNDRYNHAAVAAAISPTGKITRYIYDVAFPQATLKLALLEASEGTIGTPLDSFVLWCMHYDANENRYTADGKKLLSIVAGMFVIAVLILIVPFWVSQKGPRDRNGPASVAVLDPSREPEEPVDCDARVKELTV